MAAVLKTVWAARLTGVQIPPPPPRAEKFRVSGSKRMYSHIRIRFFGAKDAVSSGLRSSNDETHNSRTVTGRADRALWLRQIDICGEVLPRDRGDLIGSLPGSCRGCRERLGGHPGGLPDLPLDGPRKTPFRPDRCVRCHERPPGISQTFGCLGGQAGWPAGP